MDRLWVFRPMVVDPLSCARGARVHIGIRLRHAQQMDGEIINPL